VPCAAQIDRLARGRTPPDLLAETFEIGTSRFVLFELPRALTVPPSFTPAERAVLKHLCAGSSSRQIAAARGTSPLTVSNQLASMYRKVGVASRHELIAVLFSAAAPTRNARCT
jgi:DNA-binding CsgD family transcriptional regulator